MRVNKLTASVALVASVLLLGIVGADVATASHTATSLSPNQIAKGATIHATISGTGFSAAGGTPTVLVSGTGVTASNVVVVSPTAITADITAAASTAQGARTVTVQQGVLGTDIAACTSCLTVDNLPFPTISSLSTGAGVNTGTASVGANGSNIQQGATLVLKRTGQSDLVVASPTVSGDGTSISGSVDLTGQAPGSWAVVVTNPDGGTTTYTGGPNNGYLVSGLAPTVGSVSPASVGKDNAGVSLALSGTNFARGATFGFGASGVTLVSSTWGSLTSYSLVVSTTGATPGTYDVKITNTDGQNATCAGCLTVTSAPVVSGVSPSSAGRGASGRHITVTGSGFVPGASVTFTGTGVTASAVLVASGTSLGFDVSVATDAAVGPRTMFVVNPDGGTSNGSAFTINDKPTVTSATPSALGQGAAVDVMLSGSGFGAGATVAVSGTGVSTSDVVVNNASSIKVHVTVAAGADIGSRNVTVSNTDGGTGTGNGILTVTSAPGVTTVSPSTVAQGVSNVTITVNGSGYQPTPSVQLRLPGAPGPDPKLTVTSVVRGSASQLTFQLSVASDAATGARDMVITNPDGGQQTTAGAITITAKPTVTSTSPDKAGQGATSLPVTITGTGFSAGATVTFSGSGVTVDPGSTNVTGPTSITLAVTVSPTAATGARTVTVTNTDGGTATCACSFTIDARPVVSSISPTGGATGTPVSVTIAGSGFVSGATVVLERTGQPSIQMASPSISSTSITGSFTLTTNSLPAAPGPWTVRVTNTDAGTGTCSGCFTVAGNQPSITSITPDSTQRSVARNVTIVGVNFTAGTALTTSSPKLTVSNLNVADDHTITATFTAAADAPIGPYDVTVTNPDTSNTTCTGCFKVTLSPTVTSVSPDAIAQGATSKTLTVNGTDFGANPTVSFSPSGIAIVSVNRVSATRLDVVVSVAPSAATGARSVTVTNSDTSSATLAAAVTVDTAPTLTAVAPASRAQGAASQTLTLTGTGFASGATVSFNPATGIAVGTVTVVSSTQITVVISIAADAPTGARDVIVTNTDFGSATKAGGFTVDAAPTIVSLSPTSAPQGVSNRTVTVTGTGFSAPASVSFSGAGVTVDSVTFDSATQLTLSVSIAQGAALGARDITVTTDGASVTKAAAFTVTAGPTVTSVAPAAAGQGVSRSVVITGTGFGAVPAVSFSGPGIAVGTVTRDSATQLTVAITIAPDATPGARDVTVTNQDGGVGSKAGIFSVDAAPTVATVSPSSLPPGATAQEVTITGTGFVAGATVSISGAGVTTGTVTVDSATQLRVSVSVAASAVGGARDVTVTNADGGTATKAGAFSVQAPGGPGTPAAGGFAGITPARLLDTRVSNQGPCVDNRTSRDLVVTGVGGVPATGVGAVSLNVTVTQPTADGFLTVYPTGAPVPPTSSLNFVAGQTVPNAVLVKVGTGGKVSILNAGGCSHVIVDVTGWYASGTPAAGGFAGLTPARLMDTRDEDGCIPNRTTRELTVAGAGGVPAGAAAVALNVTVTEPTSSGFLTVYPSGAAVPPTSSLNFVAGQTVPNAVLVKLGTGGKITILNAGGCTQVIVDVVGWFAGGAPPAAGGFVGVTPDRLLDTRQAGQGPCVSSGTARDLVVTARSGVPANAGAVALNVTATEPTSGGWLAVYPAGAQLPPTSNLNFVAGQTVPNTVLVKVGTGGKISIYDFGGCTHVIVDVVGWYAGT